MVVLKEFYFHHQETVSEINFQSQMCVSPQSVSSLQLCPSVCRTSRYAVVAYQQTHHTTWIFPKGRHSVFMPPAPASVQCQYFSHLVGPNLTESTLSVIWPPKIAGKAPVAHQFYPHRLNRLQAVCLLFRLLATLLTQLAPKPRRKTLWEKRGRRRKVAGVHGDQRCYT
jgi:hypothetical protein